METTWIYETPDGGKTVYRRPFGDHDNRELHYQDPEYLRKLQLDMLVEQWRDVISAAENDPVLKDLLDKAQTYYTLKHA